MEGRLVPGGLFLLVTAAVFASAAFATGLPSHGSGTLAVIASSAQEPQGEGAHRNAEAIAKEFGMQTQEVLALHSRGVGFGAMVKLLVLAKASGTTPAALVNATPQVNGEREFNFGERFQSLTPQQQAEVEKLGIKNLGQLISKGRGKRGP